MRNLLLVASSLVGAGEAGFLYVAFSIFAISKTPTGFASTTSGIVFLILESLALVSTFGYLGSGERSAYSVLRVLHSMGRKTRNPERARLYLHSMYSLLGLGNFLILTWVMIFIGVGWAQWNVLWAVFAGASAFSIVYYSRTVLNLLGQRYEDTRGASFPVAAAAARLADSMFSRKESEGLSVVYRALRISEVAFYNRGHRPVKFYDVMATVDGLGEVESKDLPFESLGKLARALGRLPRRDEIPQQFEDFLKEMKWPGGFEIVKPEKGPSIYDHLTLLTSVIVAAGIVLELILPGNVRDALYLGLSSLVGTETGNFLGLTILLVGVIYCLRPLAFNVRLSLVRRYMKAEDDVVQEDHPL